MSADELVVRLQATLDEKERLAQAAVDREAFWALASEWPGKPVADHVLANTPKDVLRLVQAHRDILAMFPTSAPTVDANDCFHGFQARDCGEHRTVGSRAWCYDCGEWCYPKMPCMRCHGVSEVLRALARGYGLEVTEP